MRSKPAGPRLVGALLLAIACGEGRPNLATSGTGGAAGFAGGSAGNFGNAGTGGSAGNFGNAGTGGTRCGSVGDGGSIGVDPCETWLPVQPDDSYDLVLGSVVEIGRDAGPSDAAALAAPSTGFNVRLDIQRSARGSYLGILTPRWERPSMTRGEPKADALDLFGTWHVFVGSDFDTWTHTRLPSTPTGSLDLGRALEANGTETFGPFGSQMSVPVTVNGTLAKDATAPALRLCSGLDVLPADQRFPWDPIAICASEPIDETRVSTALSVEGVASVHWSTYSLPLLPGAGSGITSLTGSLDSWDGVGGNVVVARVPANAVIDPAGHTMASDWSTERSILDPGPAQSSFGLGGAPGPQPFHWGNVSFLGTSGADPTCETGACAVIGPFHALACTGRHGIAGRLRVPAGTTGSPVVRVRYRVLSNVPGNVYALGSPFSFTMSSPGASDLPTNQDLPLLHDLGPGSGEFRYASNVVELQGSSSLAGASTREVGFAISAGAWEAIGCSDPSMDKALKVVVDSISVE